MTYYPTGNTGKIYKRRKRILAALVEPMTIKRLAGLCDLSISVTKNDIDALIIERKVKHTNARMVCREL